MGKKKGKGKQGMKCEHCHFEIRSNGNCFCNTKGVPEFINDIPEHYNRGLGMVIKSRRQYKMELKERGLEEVGNERKYVSPEYGEKLQSQKINDSFKSIRESSLAMLERYEN